MAEQPGDFLLQALGRLQTAGEGIAQRRNQRALLARQESIRQQGITREDTFRQERETTRQRELAEQVERQKTQRTEDITRQKTQRAEDITRQEGQFGRQQTRLESAEATRRKSIRNQELADEFKLGIDALTVAQVDAETDLQKEVTDQIPALVQNRLKDQIKAEEAGLVNATGDSRRALEQKIAALKNPNSAVAEKFTKEATKEFTENRKREILSEKLEKFVGPGGISPERKIELIDKIFGAEEIEEGRPEVSFELEPGTEPVGQTQDPIDRQDGGPEEPLVDLAPPADIALAEGIDETLISQGFESPREPVANFINTNLSRTAIPDFINQAVSSIETDIKSIREGPIPGQNFIKAAKTKDKLIAKLIDDTLIQQITPALNQIDDVTDEKEMVRLIKTIRGNFVDRKGLFFRAPIKELRDKTDIKKSRKKIGDILLRRATDQLKRIKKGEVIDQSSKDAAQLRQLLDSAKGIQGAFGPDAALMSPEVAAIASQQIANQSFNMGKAAVDTANQFLQSNQTELDLFGIPTFGQQGAPLAGEL